MKIGREYIGFDMWFFCGDGGRGGMIGIFLLDLEVLHWCLRVMKFLFQQDVLGIW